MQQDFADIERQMVDLFPALRVFARRFEKNADDAEDLVQETLARGLLNKHQFQPGTSLKSWLFTIMRNTFCTRYKRRVREPTGHKQDASLSAGSTPPTQEWTRRAGEVGEALNRLSPAHRDVMILVLQGATYEEAAELSACKIGTIKSRINRARVELLTALGEVDFSQGARLH